MRSVAPSLADLYGAVRGDLAVAGRIFDAELVSDEPFIDALCDQARSYRGKMLRPALLLLSGRAVGDLRPAHHTLAAVVEMVHVATLVHDDVLDKADKRRCVPTIRATGGNTEAVLLGDYLISHAFHLCSGLSSQHASRRIGATTNTVCSGELLQNHLRGRADLTEEEYFGIVERKTGALTAVACELGAYVSEAEPALVHALHTYGLSAGVAFQIVDDVLDVIGDRDRVGKTLGQDLALGKPTLPTIHCLASASSATAAALGEALVASERCDSDRVRRWLEETGSVDYALSMAARFVDRAIRQLDGLPDSSAKASLISMAEFIIERRY